MSKAKARPVNASETRPDFDVQAFLKSAGAARRVATYQEEQVVFSQGQPSDTVFFVQNGEIKISVLSRGGKEAVVAMLGPDDFFVQAEAMFALWDMQVREREVPGAVATARMLARDFPENRELRRFLTIHAPTAAMISGDDNAP